ncbi:P-loop ATPase, Sll1717 family [Gluconacetobacter tumulicola]|uniref:ATPase n=1 Tax=Gluconacetobacter tumulicola TaxID=1017177 RepID=A0A7W4JGX4_9PROT|nr:hypothetical protein [Gluconacetobacter tumulicola]MBB2181066.1 hypothetical protein [Gluconacetobacter tumulicola]
MTTLKEALQHLNIGKSVAEFDDALERYFVETNAFRELVTDQRDIIAGDKGTGKTAIYKILQKKYTTLPGLENVEVIPAFNPSGNPIFQPLTQRDPLTEYEYNLLWKSYILSFSGNWILGIYEGNFTSSMKILDKVLRGLNLRTEVDAPRNAFSRALQSIGSWFKWDSAELECSVDANGYPVITPKVQFSKESVQRIKSDDIPVESLLNLLNRCMEEADITAWIAFDRLDEAFAGHPDTEVPALRALLRTYLDFSEFNRLKIKLFVRKDLFSRITAGGFVNLTHVNARKLDIVWRDPDLLNLLSRRVRENVTFCKMLGIKDLSDQGIFDVLFPQQVDAGTRKPITWVWMMRRIRDGNDVKPPRNLIDLVQLSQDAQLKREGIEERPINSRPIFEPDALRDGLSDLSVRRVDDTLFAEAGSSVQAIEKFRGSKAEHNLASICELLGLTPDEARVQIKALTANGFLETIKDSFKVPSLYREGMKITQGKAFEANSVNDEQDD